MRAAASCSLLLLFHTATSDVLSERVSTVKPVVFASPLIREFRDLGDFANVGLTVREYPDVADDCLMLF